MVLKAAIISAQLLLPYEGIWQLGTDACDLAQADTIIQIYDKKIDMVADSTVCIFDYIDAKNGTEWQVGARCYRGSNNEPLHYNFSMAVNNNKLYIFRNNVLTSTLTRCE